MLWKQKLFCMTLSYRYTTYWTFYIFLTISHWLLQLFDQYIMWIIAAYQNLSCFFKVSIFNILTYFLIISTYLFACSSDIISMDRGNSEAPSDMLKCFVELCM